MKNLKYVEDLVKAYDEMHDEGCKDGNKLEHDTRFQDPQIYQGDEQEENQQEVADGYQKENENVGQNQMSEQYKDEDQQKVDKYVQDEEPDDEIIYDNKQIMEDQDIEKNQKESQLLEVSSIDFGVDDPNVYEQMSRAPPRKIPKLQNETAKRKPKNSSKSITKSSQQQTNGQSKKSPLQQIEQKTRFVVKNPPKKTNIPVLQAPKIGQLTVLQISRCNRTNQLIYLTQFGPVISYRRQADMKRLYPDELIKFYQGRIQFAQIPKLQK